MAERGDAKAQNELGYMYLNGNGVSHDYALAARWLRRAAEQGIADAQNELGIMYANGEGVLKDEAEASKWYRLAAEQKHTEAQDALDLMNANVRDGLESGGSSSPIEDQPSEKYAQLKEDCDKLENSFSKLVCVQQYLLKKYKTGPVPEPRKSTEEETRKSCEANWNDLYCKGVPFKATTTELRDKQTIQQELSGVIATLNAEETSKECMKSRERTRKNERIRSICRERSKRRINAEQCLEKNNGEPCLKASSGGFYLPDGGKFNSFKEYGCVIGDGDSCHRLFNGRNTDIVFRACDLNSLSACRDIAGWYDKGLRGLKTSKANAAAYWRKVCEMDWTVSDSCFNYLPEDQVANIRVMLDAENARDSARRERELRYRIDAPNREVERRNY